MPLHSIGYRSWEGRPTSWITRIGVIAMFGVRLASQSSWVRRMVLFAWLPVIWWGVGFFVFERVMGPGETNQAIDRWIPSPRVSARVKQRVTEEQLNQLSQKLRIPQVDRLTQRLKDPDGKADVDRTRNVYWGWFLMTFFRYPQALLLLFLMGAITPPLISRDIRSRAFLMYFSRPIGRFEYLVGKLLIPMAFIISVTTLPALALYIFAIGMSPDMSVVWSTWDLPLKILVATVALIIPTSLVALMLSSLTQETKFVGFSWFAFWTLGHGAWLAVLMVTAQRLDLEPLNPLVRNHPTVLNWSVLSLYNNLGDIQSWIFGFSSFREVWRGVAALTAISVVSSVVLYRRVSAPIRV